MASELEQLRDENRRLRGALENAKRGCAHCLGEGQVAVHVCGGNEDACRRRCPEGERCQHCAEIDAVLAQPAPAPADVWDHNYICSRGTVCDRCGIGPNSHGYKGQPKQPEPVSDGEVERLRAIVAKLPKTADGVPITPGMLVYHPLAGKVEVRRVGGDLYCVPESSTVTVTDWCWYSTREAALAASKGEVQHG